MNYEDIGKFIQERRKEKNLTQKELANILGITDKAVSKWERGLGCPDISLLEELSKCLDCSISEILQGSKFEDEIIVKDKLDNYTINTLEYGKNDMKKAINAFLTFIILFIAMLLVIVNINSMFKVNKLYKKPISTSYDYFEKYSEDVNELLNNINIIKNNQGNFTDWHYSIIIRDLTKVEEGLNRSVVNNEHLSYKTKESFNSLDFFILDYTYLNPTYDMSILSNVLPKYIINYEKYSDYIRYEQGTTLYYNYIQNNNYYDTYYKYELFDNNHVISNPVYDKIIHQIVVVEKYKLLTEIIMEAGDIHE